MKLQRVLLVIGVALAATACGKVGDLEPRAETFGKAGGRPI